MVPLTLFRVVVAAHPRGERRRGVMLDHDDQQRLEEIESACWRDDARFARGLRDGKPSSPRSYRTRLILLLGCVGPAALSVGLIALAPPLIMVGLVACVAAATIYSSRTLDSPPRRE
jgi:hypothetical protein